MSYNKKIRIAKKDRYKRVKFPPYPMWRKNRERHLGAILKAQDRLLALLSL
jgi:hypothetical protein